MFYIQSERAGGPHPMFGHSRLESRLLEALTAYVIHRDYRTTLTLWNSRLSGAVISRTWILRNSLQESQDDTQVLADFASTRELLLLGKDGSGVPVPRAALLKQVVGLFDEYRRVYEYAAVCLLDPEGRVVVEATDSTAWAGVIQSAQFKDLIRAVDKPPALRGRDSSNILRRTRPDLYDAGICGRRSQ